MISDSSGTHSFATLVFYRLIHPAEAINSKPPIRTDVLGTYLQEPKGLKKFLIGRAYSQYERLVDKLKCAGTYNDGGLKDPRTNIEQIEQLLIEIRAQYKAAGCLTNIRELSRLEAILVQQKTAADLPPLCLDMLKILQAALAHRKELSKKLTALGKKLCATSISALCSCAENSRHIIGRRAIRNAARLRRRKPSLTSGCAWFWNPS